MPPLEALAAISLRMCCRCTSATRTEIYPQVEDNSTPLVLQFETPKDSLWFQVKEDLVVADLVEAGHRLRVDDSGTHILEVDEQGDEDEDDGGDDQDDGTNDKESEEEEKDEDHL